MFFDNWLGVLRVLVVGVVAYAALVLLLRVSGKRTLAKLNAFDLIVTVALGSTLATVVLSKSVALAEGLAAFILLVGMQYLVAWLSVRSPRFSDLVKSEPTLLLHQGRFPGRSNACAARDARRGSRSVAEFGCGRGWAGRSRGARNGREPQRYSKPRPIWKH